jgi:FAD/FMN-containing dehydrogenase
VSKVAHYLQEHLVGEVLTATDARRYFSTDSSILQIAPSLIAYPKNENDIRKAARFTWQLAERGRVIGLTARGRGSNQSGAAIGEGIILVFPAHMNRILEIDTKANTVSVEPGIIFGKLQQTLFTHGRFVPAYPSTLDYSTVGGAVGTNPAGEKSVKYGPISQYIKSLRVVLANGEVIETRRLNKRDLSKKLGMATFEGEIYRSVDALLEEKHELIGTMERNLSHSSAGYDLLSIKKRDGSFDLTPLIVGSQGTLGIVTEVTLTTESHNPQTTLILAHFDSLEKLQSAVNELKSLTHPPSSIEMVDGNLLKQAYELNPNSLKGLVQPPFPLATLLIEFDDREKTQKKAAKKNRKIFENYAISSQISSDPEQQQAFWKIRQVSGVVMAHNQALRKSVPLFDGVVSPERLREYIEKFYHMMQLNGEEPSIWGHAADSILHAQPMLNLGQVGDLQKAFRMLDEYTEIVLSLGGGISAEAGDGRLRAPYLEKMFGTEVYNLLIKVKKIFDPYGTLNPGVKFGTTIDDLKAIVRPDYNLDDLYNHLPRN